jgi:tricorn protease-like protein
MLPILCLVSKERSTGKSTSLYRLSLNGGEAKEIARFDKPGMSVLGYLNEKTLVLLTKEKQTFLKVIQKPIISSLDV